jgi:formate hydrogenlyase transcriptional activator
MVQQDTLALKYSALSEMCRSIAARRDLSNIFADLAERISQLVPFHYVSVSLHVSERNMMRLHVLHGDGANPDWVGQEFGVRESPAGHVWETQQVVTCPDLAEDDRFPKAYSALRGQGVLSFCAIPLTTAEHRLGSLLFGRATPGGFEAEELEFAKLIGTQVAVALENALQHERSATLQRELARERDRLQLVLELNNAVVSNLDLREMFSALSTNLRRIVDYDSGSLLLPEDSLRLRVHALDFPQARGFLQQGMLISMAEGPFRIAFQTAEAVLAGAGGLDFSPHAEAIRVREGEGFLSALIVPLMKGETILGALSLSSRREAAFTQADLGFATEIGRQVAIAVNNALQHRALSESREQISEQKSYLEDEIRAEQDFEDIVGSSRVLRDVLEKVETVAPTDSTVLICGETGTGKELIARAIHERSGRRDRTFVKINCAAIPLGLLESELFGHEKGAFTGAITRKIGRFELADHGSLFLDEVGDIPPELQPKLLRVLQEQEFERLGSSHTHQVNVRIIAATNHNLGAMVAEGRFRSDLFYRLNVFPIMVPPLRERREDIPPLARYFVTKYARRMNKKISRISPSTLEALMSYSWPGNVRELQNFLERAVILTSGSDLLAPLSELTAASAKAAAGDGSATLREMETNHILSTLRQTNWVVGGRGGAAARLGMKRTTLLYRMERLGISRDARVPTSGSNS